MTRFATAAVLSTLSLLAFGAGPAAAKACTDGVCADSRDDGRTVNVYLSAKVLGVTHFNVRRGGRQFESSGQFSFAARPGYDQNYSVQACRRGGFLQRSSCTPWASFYHTTKEPKRFISQS